MKKLSAAYFHLLHCCFSRSVLLLWLLLLPLNLPMTL